MSIKCLPGGNHILRGTWNTGKKFDELRGEIWRCVYVYPPNHSYFNTFVHESMSCLKIATLLSICFKSYAKCFINVSYYTMALFKIRLSFLFSRWGNWISKR